MSDFVGIGQGLSPIYLSAAHQGLAQCPGRSSTCSSAWQCGKALEIETEAFNL